MAITGQESRWGTNVTPPINPRTGKPVTSSMGLIQAQNGWWQDNGMGTPASYRSNNAVAMMALAKYLHDQQNGIHSVLNKQNNQIKESSNHEKLSLDDAIKAFHGGLGAVYDSRGGLDTSGVNEYLDSVHRLEKQ